MNARAQLRAVMTKELRQLLRDPRMFGVLLVAPILQLTLLGFAVNLDVRAIPCAVMDLDGSAASRGVIDAIGAQDTFRLVGETRDAVGTLERGEAQVVFVLPAHLARGERVVQVLIDGTNPVVAQTALNVSRQLIESRGLAMLAEQASLAASLGAAPPALSVIRPSPRVLYNPRLESAQAMIPGVAAMVLLVVTTVVTAMGIAREKELGTIEQLLVTPIQPSTLLLGKTLPFAGIGMVTAGLVLSVGTHLFDVPIRGSLAVLALGVALYLLTTLGAGVLISTLARTQQQAILGAFFFLLPAILLSGFMSPISNMPPWIQTLTYPNPVRHFVVLLRAVMLKGAELSDLHEPLLVLITFGLAMQLIAARRFRKRLA